MPRRVVSLAAGLVLPLALAACGTPTRATPSTKAQPNPVRSASPTVFPAPSKSATPPPSAQPTGGGSASPTGQPGGGGNSVQATADNKFAPAEISVKAGTEVTWTAAGFHTVTGGKDGKKDPTSPMQSPVGFQTYKVKFDKPGTYDYYCEPHLSLGMVGKVVVT